MSRTTQPGSATIGGTGTHRSRTIARSFAALAAALTLAVTALSFPASQTSAAADIVVFDDALGAGFQNWSWADVDPASTAPVASGERAISIDYGPWEGLFLAAPDGVDLPAHGTLDFAIHGGSDTAAAAAIVVALVDRSYQQLGSVHVEPVPGAWSVMSLPLADFGSPSNVGGIWWQNGSSEARPTVSIDDITIAHGTPPEPDPDPVCVPGVPGGALPTQPEFVGCGALTTGPDTSIAGDNTWLDDFDHGLEFADFSGMSYRVFDGLGVEGSVHWRHADHWMVDVATPESGGITGGAMLSPNQTFGFEDGMLVVEADAVVQHPDYEGVWPELVISTGADPTTPRYGELYGYDRFPGHYTLGCRLQQDSNTICSLMGESDQAGNGAGRIWEMSWFQQVGTSVSGGNRFADDGVYFRSCDEGDADTACRDRFRLELTETSLTIFVNGFKYFEQTGVPALPAQLLQGDLYVYFGSMVSRPAGDSVRFHWDRLAVNPSTGPSASPTWPTPQ